MPKTLMIGLMIRKDPMLSCATGPRSSTSVNITADKMTELEVTAHTETAHVGDIAFEIMVPEMLEANGSGVDAVSGATFSTRGLRNAVNAAAEKAGCTNIDAFKAAKVEHKAGAPEKYTYDVVIIGAGGAGVAAGAQAAQDGNTVLIIEKNAEAGAGFSCSCT